MPTSYKKYPLVLPLDDDEDDFTYYPLVISKRVDFAERFRRQGKVIYWQTKWGKGGYPAGLSLNNVLSINWIWWHRDQEPYDLTSYAQLAASEVPHGWWKWRIYAEPKGIPGALYEIDNPAGGGGASIMAEDYLTADGALTNLPSSFSAPLAHFSRTAGLQLGYTTDNGASIVWANPVWN